MKRLATALFLAVALIAYAPGAPVPQQSVSARTEQAGNPSVKVWVNTDSGVYHCPGTRWYGKTKQGQYMTQKQAQAAGYRPAYGSVCG